jgi:hypothetical protein
LQLDNTVKWVEQNLENKSFGYQHNRKSLICRECKNRYIFSYLKSLVDTGVFQHVYLSFLPVGHTHADIDQMFSRISVYMNGKF